MHTPNIFDNYELNTMNDLGALFNYTKLYRLELNDESPEIHVIGQATKMRLIKNDRLNVENQ